MTGFTIVDQVETDAEGSLLVEPDPPAYTFALSGSGAPSGDPGFTASLDETTGVLTITPPDGFVFNAGWTLTVNAPLHVPRRRHPGHDGDNEVTVTSDRLFETCEGTTVVDGVDLTPKPVENTPPGVPECSADTEITPLAIATIAAKKYVRGNDAGDPAVPGDDDLGVLNVDGDAAACDPSVPGVVDDGFYSFPCAPVTRPGGEETWRVDFTNAGNTSARVVAAVDTLPTVGDQGVIVPGDRGSQFPVTLSGTVSANFAELADSAYSTGSHLLLDRAAQPRTATPTRSKVWTEDAAPDPACDFDWQLSSGSTPPETLAAVRSVMVVLEYDNPAPALAGSGPASRRDAPGRVRDADAVRAPGGIGGAVGAARRVQLVRDGIPLQRDGDPAGARRRSSSSRRRWASRRRRVSCCCRRSSRRPSSPPTSSCPTAIRCS